MYLLSNDLFYLSGGLGGHTARDVDDAYIRRYLDQILARLKRLRERLEGDQSGAD
jgi:hypothetical protein